MSRRKTTQTAEAVPELEQPLVQEPVVEQLQEQSAVQEPVVEQLQEQSAVQEPVVEPTLEQNPDQNDPQQPDTLTVVMLDSMAGLNIDWPVGSEQTIESAAAQRLIDAGLAKAKE